MSSFKQADLTRALRAVQKAGKQPLGVSLTPDGSIRIDFAKAEESESPLDQWMRDNARSTPRS